MWGDNKFKALSKPRPCGQSLWIYLLTGPHTSSLPCAFIAGEASLSESLDWPLATFRKVFDEVLAKGMALADWSNRLLFIPKAMQHNPPENPNVVKSWRTAFDELPDCPLKMVIYAAVTDYLEGRVRDEGWSEAFRKAFGKDYALVLPKTEQSITEQTQGRAPPALRKAFGEFENVKLSEAEFAKLNQRLNGYLESYINRLDRWGAESPSEFAKKKNHYATILNWFDRDLKDGKIQANPKQKRMPL